MCVGDVIEAHSRQMTPNLLVTNSANDKGDKAENSPRQFRGISEWRREYLLQE